MDDCAIRYNVFLEIEYDVEHDAIVIRNCVSFMVFLQNYTEFIDITVGIDTRALVQGGIGRSKHARLITSTRRRT